MFSEYPDILTIDDVIKLLAVGRTTAYKLLRNNQIRHLRVGKSIKIPKQYLIDFITQSSYNIPTTEGSLSCHGEG